MKKTVIKSAEKQIVYGEVYSPFEVDTDGDAATPEEIEKAAHEFLSSGKVNNIDLLHNFKATGSQVVESFMVEKGDPRGFAEGSWVLGVKVNDPDLWNSVKDGKINGFSLAGQSIKVPAKVTVTEIQSLEGTTEKNTDSIIPPHSHDVSLAFDEKGFIVPTLTKEAMGHSHMVKAMTATEMEGGHAHRLIVEDGENEPEN